MQQQVVLSVLVGLVVYLLLVPVIGVSVVIGIILAVVALIGSLGAQGYVVRRKR